MSDQFRCPKCDSAMEHGFLMDRGNNNVVYEVAWLPGDPKKASFWQGLTGVATRDQIKAALTIISLRCTACGYLESYAPPLPPPAPAV